MADEAKQLKSSWFEFFRTKPIVPIPSEGVDLPSKSERTTPYCFTVERVDNVVIPAQLTKDIEEEFTILHRFNLSLFHPPSKRFFGNTFVGGAFSPISVTKDKIEVGKTYHNIEFNQKVFFHTTIIDNKCVALMELVAVIFVGDVEVREAGVGWTFVNLFGDILFEHTDLLDDTTAPEVVVSQVYSGSPRAALFAGGDSLAGKGLTVIPTCEVTHTLQTHQTLRVAVHLLRENEMVGEWDVIPGVVRIPEEGVEAREEDFSPYYPTQELKTSLFRPLVAPSVSLFVGNFRVEVPRQLEESLAKSLNANRFLEYDVQPDQKEPSILERRITLGAHNGRGFTGPLSRHVLHAEQHATGGEGGAWRFQGSVAFSGVAAHPCFALLAQLEYLVRVPLNPTVKSETKVPLSVDVVIPLGWTVHIPYNGESFLTGPMALSLRQGPDASPISNSFIFSSPDIKVRLVLECVIHTESSAEPIPSAEVPASPPQFISSSNFRVLRGLPPPSPNMARRSLRSSLRSSAPLRSSTIAVSRSQLGASSASAVPKQQEREQEQEKDLSSSQNLPRGRPRSTPSQLKPSTLPMMRLDPESDIEDDPDATPLPTPKMNLNAVANAPPRASTMTRANKAKLFENSINYVDSTRTSQPPATADSKVQEEPTEAYEIIIQFLAFSRVPDAITKSNAPHSLRTLFFTLQFYRFAPHTTERLFLQEGAEPRLLVRADAQKGLQVRYLAEGKAFQSYLDERILSIDVWDGESLLCLGTVRVPLRALLRAPGQRNTQVTDEYDIVYKEHLPADETRGVVNTLGDHVGDSHLRGRLHLRLGSNGKDLLGLDPSLLSHPVVLLDQQKPLAQASGSKVVTRRLADTDKDLDLSLKQRKLAEPYVPAILSNDPQQAALAEIQRRKKARLERYRRMVNKRPAARSGTIQERQADLRTVQLYRDRSKREVITRKLRLYTTTSHTIFPSCGSTHFFEFSFHNPYSKEQCFYVEFDDPELSLVTNPEEWRFLKKKHNLVTPMEEDMLDGNKLWMHPNEALTIPFKFQSFQSGHVGATEEGGGVTSFLPQPPPDEPIRPRSISVVFVAESNPESSYQPNARKVMCILEIRVVPQPFIVDRAFRFYHAENDFLKKTVVLEQNLSQPRKYIKCNNSNVIVGYNPQNDERDPSSLFIKARCGQSPSVSRFYVQLFHDPFMATLAETWQVDIHSLQRLDVNGVLGQTTKATLVLRGGQKSRLVQCFSSSPEVLRLNPEASFTLVSGALNEVSMTYRPDHTGKQELYVHVVDVEFHQLVSAYLVQANSTNPAITKSFDITLAAGKGSNKKISYTNPYPFRKTFQLRTNKPNLLQFKEPRMEVNPKEKLFIALRFLPSEYVHGKTEIFVFINDTEYDKIEECVALSVEYLEDE